jgi:hypothetical protein
MATDFDTQRKREEEERLQRAASRAEERGGAPSVVVNSAPTWGPRWTADLGPDANKWRIGTALGFLGAIPLGVGGVALAAPIVGFGGSLVVAAGLFGSAAALCLVSFGKLGKLAKDRGHTPRHPIFGRSSAEQTGDPHMFAAYDRALEAINGSSRIDAERSLELAGLLRASYEEVTKLELQRPALVAGLNSLPADGGGEVGVSLRQAAEQLDARRDAFLSQCTKIQASVAMLGVHAESTVSAIEQLVSATSSFGEEAKAHAELEDTITAARAAQKMPAGSR